MSGYPRAEDLRPPPTCVVCHAVIDVETVPIPRTDRVDIVNATCTNPDVGVRVAHNRRNAEHYGGRLERVWARHAVLRWAASWSPGDGVTW